MNLQPPRLSQEPVTVVLVPLEHYGSLVPAVDKLYAQAGHPIDIIVVEGHAPFSVRHALESRQKRHPGLRILYTDYSPDLAQAYNLALVHIRTPWAFFMHAELDMPSKWLHRMVHRYKDHYGIFCPLLQLKSTIASADPVFPFFSPNGCPDPRFYMAASHCLSFLASRDALDKIGEFDTRIGTAFMGLHLAIQSVEHSLAFKVDTETSFEVAHAPRRMRSDLPLISRQWSPEKAKTSFHHIYKKCGIDFNERLYQNWVRHKLEPGSDEARPTWGEDSHSPAVYLVGKLLRKLKRA